MAAVGSRLQAAEASFSAVWFSDSSGFSEKKLRWSELTGQNDDQSRGFGWLDMLRPNNRKNFERNFAIARDKVTVLRTTVSVFVQQNNQFQRTTLTCSPILSQFGAVEEWLFGVTLIEEEQEEQEEQMEEINASQTLPNYLTLLIGGGSMGDLIRNLDWSQTALGPIQNWPQSLLTIINLLLNSKFPMTIFWGPEFNVIYNDAYIPILAAKHPRVLGKSGFEVWEEIWPVIHPMFLKVYEGEATWSVDQLLLMIRNGYLEEGYFTWSYSPMHIENGQIGGILSPSVDTTTRVLGERRLKTLRELGARSSGSTTMESACKILAQVLEENNQDITFGLIYIFQAETGKLKLKASSCIAHDHRAVFDEIDLASSNHDTHWSSACAQALQDQTVVVVNNLVEKFGELPGGLWPESPSLAAVIPFGKSKAGSFEGQAFGVLIAGINSRRHLDTNYVDWLELATRQIGNAIASADSYQLERKRAESLAEIDKAKTVFFANVSHEFRTPLTLILGPLEDTLADTTTPLELSHRHRLELMHRNCFRLLKLVNSLLDFSRIEAGKIHASFVATDFSQFTADLSSAFRSLIESTGVQFIVKTPPLPSPVYIDQDSYEKILFNLISNAFKFTLRGQISVEVRVSEDRANAELVVSDTGCGIVAEEQASMFQRFYRASSSHGRSFEGSGIGLALTSELAKLHGGSIRLQSTYGVGSTFIVSFPFGIPANQQIAEPQQPFKSSSSLRMAFFEEASRWITGPTAIQNNNNIDQPPSTTSPSLMASSSSSSLLMTPSTGQTFTVLVVDDNSDLREYLYDILSRLYNVRLAGDGLEALKSIEQCGVPDLIVSDIMMPNMSGIELLRHIRNDQVLCHTPIILLSARAGTEASVEGLAMGADDYLVKPFSQKELVARVKTQLDLSTLRRHLEDLVNERTVALRQSEKRYRTLAELSPVGICQVNAQQIIEYTNDRMGEIMDDVDHQGDWQQRIHPDDLPLFFSKAESARTGEKSAPIPLRFFRKNGELRYLLAQVIGDIHTHNIVWAITDITEQKHLEQQRYDALSQVEQAQRQRAEDAEQNRRNQELFVDTICHEIRNPLSAIYGIVDHMRSNLTSLAQALRSSRINDDQHFLEALDEDLMNLDAIEVCATHQRMITDDVLNVSRLHAGKFSLSNEDFFLDDLIRKCLRMFDAQLKQQKIELSTNLSTFPSTMKLHSDPQRLSQIMMNLLSNAIKFTRHKDLRQIFVYVRIHTSPSQDYAKIEISVRDTGIGMTLEEQARLFVPFSQMKSHDTYDASGSGLGLYICKQIVQLMNGEITVASQKNVGSEFIVTVPCQVVHTVAEPVQTLAPVKDLTEIKQTKPIKILVVEDNEVNRKVLCRQLSTSKEVSFEVFTANDGLQAVNVVEEQSLDVILMDVEMPIMNGIEATQRIRAREAALDLTPVPIIGLSGNARQKHIDEGLGVGMTDYVVKPYSKDFLIQKIVQLTTATNE